MASDIIIRSCSMADVPLADYVIRHPEVYSMCQWDGKPEDPGSFSCVARVSIGPPMYVLIDDTNSLVATFTPETNIMWSVHSFALPTVRGKKAVAIGKAMAQWMFDNTRCQRIIGFTPSNHKAALLFNKWVGFKTIGRLDKAYSASGETESVDIVSICKE